MSYKNCALGRSRTCMETVGRKSASPSVRAILTASTNSATKASVGTLPHDLNN